MLDGDSSEVRTFRAPNPKAALQAVKLAFGDDAIILSSREVAGGLFKPKQIEVVARRGTPEVEETVAPAPEERSEASRVLAFHAAQRRASGPGKASKRPSALPKTRRLNVETTKVKAQPARSESFEERYERERNQRQAPQSLSVQQAQHAQQHQAQQQVQQQQAQQQQVQQQQVQQQQVQQQQVQQQQVQQQQVQQQQVQQQQVQHAQNFAPMPQMHAQPAFNAVQQAVSSRLEQDPSFSPLAAGANVSMANMPMQQMQPQFGVNAQEIAQRTFLLTQLIERGLDDKLATGLLDDAFRQIGGRVDPIGRLRRTVRGMVSIARAPWSPDPTGDRSILALVGPTGVGKTTTVAKIAARARMEFGLKVCMITIDTYRIGAIDQLARYGELMGVPTYVARDQSSFGDALEHTHDADLVLVDTAGRSPTDKDAIAQQAALLRSWSEVQLHLAVPAATSSRQLSVILDRYQTMDPERILVTKVDEAAGPGSVFNIASRAEAPISCITDGQRVPEDLHGPSMSAIVDWVVPK